jgi:hypothetical protein
MKPALTRAILIIICLQFSRQSFSQTSIFAIGAAWKYSAAATAPANDAQGDTWIESDYDDAAWSSGNAQFHVGESGSTDLGTLRNTFYFRKSITVSPLSSFVSFNFNIIRDDGAVVYVNGVEVGRTNMPTGTVNFNTNASGSIGNGSEPNFNLISVSKCYFTEGTNIIAVEVHQAATNNSDMRFDMKLDGIAASTVALARGPYLNMGNQSAVTIRWNTDLLSVGRVEVGTTHGTYPLVFDETCPTTTHEIRITGLTADTKYYYRFGTTNSQVIQNGTTNFFRTAPLTNTTRTLHFAAFGDCGTNSLSYQSNSLAQYQTYLTSNSIDAPDAWLLLGDNAYNAGLDGEYKTGFFDPYQGTITKNHILFPVPGNHDYANTGARQIDHAIPYYDIFTLPTNGESGGIASGTEAYYSWNWGDVHFLALDAYGYENSGTTRLYDTTGAQMLWVKADMAANTKKWTIAYWHHPPYTMGSHTSDGETELVNIRARTIKVLERLGIDMIICGHSHDYERSKLMNGHYGNEVATGSMTPFLKSSTSGKYDGTVNSCVYKTNSNTANHGTVYVVAGSSGNSGGTNPGIDGYPHNALPYSINDGGIFVFDITENRLDAKFIEQNGTIFDNFTIMKDVDKTTNQTIPMGSSVTLTASWNGTYSWNTGATTKSVNVTPVTAETTYTVQDGLGCILDQFNISASGTLPVSLKNYFVTLRDQKVFVDWTTAAEINNRDFTIERSANAQQFSNIGVVHAVGNSNSDQAYQFIDPSPLDGVSYYRLMQTDIDGAVKMFPVKKIVNNKQKGFYADAFVSASQTVTMQVYSSIPERIQVRAFDMTGRVVKSESWMLNSGSNNRNIDLKTGAYVLEWKRTDGVAVSQKIMVQ